jgi:hypothetical protein
MLTLKSPGIYLGRPQPWEMVERFRRCLCARTEEDERGRSIELWRSWFFFLLACGSLKFDGLRSLDLEMPVLGASQQGRPLPSNHTRQPANRAWPSAFLLLFLPTTRLLPIIVSPRERAGRKTSFSQVVRLLSGNCRSTRSLTKESISA